MSKKPRILVSPLDWGLGHATRCIPIVKALWAQNCEVVLASSGAQAILLKAEFANIEIIEFPGYNITYPRSGNMAMKMLLSTPSILKSIKKEHQLLQEIIKEHHIDAVISDNRFGLYSDLVPCIYITHQIHIQAPVFEGGMYKMHKRYIDKFTACWIPDAPGEENLSGRLSHQEKMPENVRFIGPLSRFYVAPPIEKDIDALVILSGPEPQRTLFEELIVEQLKTFEGKAILVRGLPEGGSKPKLPKRIGIYNHLPFIALGELLHRAKMVVCRPGYSSLMDLAVFGVPAILIPTPGQTEQEYLADFHQEKGHFLKQKQSELDLEKGISEITNFTGVKLVSDGTLLQAQIQHLLELI